MHFWESVIYWRLPRRCERECKPATKASIVHRKALLSVEVRMAALAAVTRQIIDQCAKRRLEYPVTEALAVFVVRMVRRAALLPTDVL